MMPYTQQPGGKVPCQQIPSHDITEALTEEQEIQIFAKQMLINRLFLGHYQERRFVESLGTYRDVVVVTKSECELKKDLDSVRKRLKHFYKFSKIWVGITGPDLTGAPAGHAIWVKLQNLAFGYYWFQIRQVKFVEDREMILRIKCVRAVTVGSEDVKNEIGESERVWETSEENPAPANSDVAVDWDRVKRKWKDTTEQALTNLISVMSVHNAKEVICFTSVFIVACVTGFFHSIRYVGDYSIKFMREFSIFIQASTPVFLAVIDFFAKCVGGLYLLIAMLWRGTPAKPSPYPSWRPNQRALPMPPNMHFGYRS